MGDVTHCRESVTLYLRSRKSGRGGHGQVVISAHIGWVRFGGECLITVRVDVTPLHTATVSAARGGLRHQ